MSQFPAPQELVKQVMGACSVQNRRSVVDQRNDNQFGKPGRVNGQGAAEEGCKSSNLLLRLALPEREVGTVTGAAFPATGSLG